MIKVAVIEPSGNLYGSEMVLLDILENLDTEKFAFTVFLPVGSPFSNLLIKNDIPFLETLSSPLSNILEKVKGYFNTNKEIKKGSFDLIFINQAGILRPISFFNNIRGKKPILCEVSTLEDANWVNQQSKRITKRVKSFIGNSSFITEKIKVNRCLKSTLYYGYQPKNLLKKASKKTKSLFNIILLGRISKSKGHFLLIEAAKEMKHHPFKFYIVGNAPTKEIEDDFKRKIQAEGLENQFVLRGFRQNILEELAEMDMMVIPSLKEPFGRIFCEAAEAGLPTVVSDSGGLGELSRYFDVGLRFSPEKPEDLANKIIYMYENIEKIGPVYEQKANAMLRSLNMDSYIKKVEYLIEHAAKGEELSLNWYGDK